MKKSFSVGGIVTCSVFIDVIAENEEDAIKKAESEFGGIIAFIGNGGSDKLIGVCHRKESIQCDDDVIWKYAEENKGWFEKEEEEEDEEE